MNILIVLAHPGKESLNHALCREIITVLRQEHVVVLHDLYADAFDPVLKENELLDINFLNEDIKLYCDDLKNADCLIIIHPNWWGAPPAILKGWIDRVIRLNVGYAFNDRGEGEPVQLLKLQHFFVFNTSNTSALREQNVFHDPLESIWRNCISDFLGAVHFERSVFRIVVTSTETERRNWIQSSCELVHRKLKG